MHVIPSLESQKSNNNGSCSLYGHYITKYTDGLVFNSHAENINVEEAINLIDINSRGGIRKNESKWYSPVYSFSEDEALFIAASILQNGTLESRKIKNFDGLNDNEKSLYNAKIKQLVLLFQTEMAKNFHKQNLGINDKDDILWFGAIENKRKYTGYDDEVKKGFAKQGDYKKGFNTHIHIIQSRKALNKKKSLISPMANARIKTSQGAGFFRNEFYNAIEQTFDKSTGYKRREDKKFEFYKARKKETYSYYKPNKNSSTTENRKKNKPFKEKQKEDKEIISNAKTIDYFFHLEKRGLVKFDKKKGNNYYFAKNGQKTGSIAVNDKGWLDFSCDESGGILKAIKKYDKFDWNESIALIKVLDKNYTESKQIKEERRIISVKEIQNIKLINYINSRGITLNIAKKYLKEVHYKNTDSGTTYQSLGFKNNSNGYTLRSENFKSFIGSVDLTTLNFENDNKKVKIFEGFFNYLSYLEHNKISETSDKIIVLNSTSNFKKLKTFISTLKNDLTYKYYGDNDRAGEKIFDKLKSLHSWKIK